MDTPAAYVAAAVAKAAAAMGASESELERLEVTLAEAASLGLGSQLLRLATTPVARGLQPDRLLHALRMTDGRATKAQRYLELYGDG
mmetsp:Transcript_22434/g.57143  ORF Transcript_22434/g.57143 Transcript_22434/m.57143 type:complete len:87 (+) Transcript_22434:2409-2669(+)